jgi:hypothetical protein
MNPSLFRAVLLLFLSIYSAHVTAQSVAINDDASLPHASAILDIKVAAAAKKGVLLPRMTSAQRAAIIAPGKGLLVYDSTANSFWFHNGTAWTEISKGVNPWTVNGSNIYNLAGNIGIGTATPKAKLNVANNQNVLFGLSMTGVGSKMYFNAAKSAFRSGAIEVPDEGLGTNVWDDANVGQYSFATGLNTRAAAMGSAAFGQHNQVTGLWSLVGGTFSTVEGWNSIAFGFSSFAGNDEAMALGRGATALGFASAAFNIGSRSEGDESFTANSDNTSSALSAATFGRSNINNSNNGFVVGQSNDPVVAIASSALATAPIFIVGNGTDALRKNAMVVLRNGLTGFNKNPGSVAVNDGLLQLKQSGSKHLLTLEAATTTNKWSFSMTPNMTLYYNNVLRGTFNAANGVYTAVSDVRLKKDIHSLQPILEDIMLLKTYTYHLLDNDDDSPLSYGLMAQELQQVFPDMVTQIDPTNKESVLGINYNNLSVLSIKGLQEIKVIIESQQQQIEQGRAENAALRQELDAQKERLKKLETALQLSKN